ncbi:MAG: motility associated factor glycosyltransferase family protein [Deltaproteobacteria bacterium]|nr:motility associated factor glycosyltransferase family protein [Deltaproteobacteria bacterium]MBN2670509.1 motility associated factor glycosyltransferase family protein [Deltaproteobacteria bacterium]
MTQPLNAIQQNLNRIPVLGTSAEEILNCPVSNVTFGMNERKQPWLCFKKDHLYDEINPLVRTVEDIQALGITEPNDLLLFFGLGLGFHAELLAAQKKGPLLIFEPNIEIIAVAMRSRVLNLPNTRIITQFSTLYDTMKKALFLTTRTVSAGAMPRYKNVFPRECDRFTSTASQVLTDLNIKNESQNKYTEALGLAAQSLRLVSQLPPVEALKPLVTGKPGIFVGAGPSLDNNIEALKDAQNHSLIVAANSALRPLHRAGITPDMVLVVETNDLSTHFNIGDLNKTTLIVTGASHQSYLRMPFRHTFSIVTSGNPYGDWMARAQNRLVIPAAGSVALVAFSLLQKLGCDPIIGAGMDLSYQTGASHAAGAEDADTWVKINPDKGTLIGYVHPENTTGADASKHHPLDGAPVELEAYEVRGWEENSTVFTTSVFNSYRLWLEHAAESWASENHLYNCTEGGAYIEGFNHQPLKDVIHACCTEEMPVSQWLDNIARTHTPFPSEPLQRVVAADLEILSKVGFIARETASRCDQLNSKIKNQSDISDETTRQLQQIADMKQAILKTAESSVLMNRLIVSSLEAAAQQPAPGPSPALNQLLRDAHFFTDIQRNAAAQHAAFESLLAP